MSDPTPGAAPELTTVAGVPMSLNDIRIWAQQTEASERLTPWSAESLEVCDRLSQALMRHPQLGTIADVVALAFWLRRSSLTRLRDDFQARLPADVVPVPRGLAFHLPPTNVDTLFVYSWALSFLLGNRNLVRISRRSQALANHLCKTLIQTLEADAHPGVVRNTLFIRYDHDEQITETCSSLCNIRVIWGGDDSVQAIRKVPLPPLAVDLVFPSRTSLCVMSAPAVLALADSGLQTLARHFFNDLLTFDQMACSSPRKLVWIGTSEQTHAAETKFCHALINVINEREYQVSASVVLQKLTLAAGGLIDGVVRSQHRYAPALTILEMKSVEDELSDFCGGGLLMSFHVEQPEGVEPLFRRREQTLTSYGLDRQVLHHWITNAGAHSVDRMVPVGQALAFSAFWDGMDMLLQLSRQVYLPQTLMTGMPS